MIELIYIEMINVRSPFCYKIFESIMLDPWDETLVTMVHTMYLWHIRLYSWMDGNLRYVKQPDIYKFSIRMKNACISTFFFLN